ncbi:hypothetical protein WICMUC_001961 [Wickerhamomyces mucosus]|uniref:J domain-containing protein n=1 Tax=Wickerhamomyces mucosus TaxID=1378264 RepID=A0A9P8PT21_9ASCO|nr:hypothetical protein WICMUC_001961 [Wickerhamomyces mucosus]
MIKRLFSTTKPSFQKNYFELFPSTFPKSKNSSPFNLFKVDSKKLRKEYRSLQAIHHPDKVQNQDFEQNQEDDFSNLLNRAYTQLKSPLNRSQYILNLNGINLSKDDNIINNEILMEILTINEKLENIENESELEELQIQNDNKIKELTTKLEKLFELNQLDKAAQTTINLKYYENIKTSIKNWERGKPITLTH